MQGWNSQDSIRKRKIRFGKEYNEQMKRKLSCLVIIIEIMYLLTKEHGTIYQIWGYFSAKDVDKILVIDSKMNAQKYIQILQENLMSSVGSLELPSEYIFQQDKDPKYTAKSTKKLLSEKMSMFCNGQISSQIWIQSGTCGDFWKSISEKEH